jgi:hypothetical protein
MTPEELLEAINNLEVREPIRKYAPKWSVVFVDEKGGIVDVLKYKSMPSMIATRELHSRYPDTVYFIAESGMFQTLAEIREKLADCVEAHKIPAPKPTDQGE